MWGWVDSVFGGGGGGKQEVLKQRIQADIYPNVAVALPAVLQKEGVMGLFKFSPPPLLSRSASHSPPSPWPR